MATRSVTAFCKFHSKPPDPRLVVPAKPKPGCATPTIVILHFSHTRKHTHTQIHSHTSIQASTFRYALVADKRNGRQEDTPSHHMHLTRLRASKKMKSFSLNTAPPHSLPVRKRKHVSCRSVASFLKAKTRSSVYSPHQVHRLQS